MLEINRFYTGNNCDIIKEIDSNSTDLILESPPYDSARTYKGYTFDYKTLGKESYRILKDGGVMVWVVDNMVIKGSESLSAFKQAIYFVEECGFNLHDSMIYEKTGTPYPSTNRYYQNYEYMFILSKGKPKTVNLIKDKPNSNAGKPAHWGKMTYRQKDGTLKEMGENYITPEFGVRTNIWRYKTGGHNVTTDKIAYQHPAIFPEQLAHDHIISWTNPGELVIDCFSGSGTVAKMAKLSGRNFIGIDISQEYNDIAMERLSNL